MTTTSKLTVSCNCGEFSAVVTIDKNQLPTRLKCYCSDCQAYAYHLENADSQLDLKGGSDLIQISPAQFSIVRGEQHLGNLNMTPNGVYRWHTTCCQTGIANTPPSAKMPYVGLLCNTIKKASNVPDKAINRSSKKSNKTKAGMLSITDDMREEQLNAILGAVQFGVGAGTRHPLQASWPISKGFGVRGMFSTLRNMARWRLRGDQKRSVFIDSETDEPLVSPTLVSKAERQAALQNVLYR